MTPETSLAIDEVARELDLVVFQLEQRGGDEEALRKERQGVRRQLERLRDRLQELARRG
jgi:hypothetical protein